jgi:hypothetical protein
MEALQRSLIAAIRTDLTGGAVVALALSIVGMVTIAVVAFVAVAGMP